MMDEEEAFEMRETNDNEFRVRPTLRTLIGRQSKPIVMDVQDPITGEWRSIVKMSNVKFDDEAKGIFLREYEKWGRMGESAAAAGVTPQTVRKYMQIDEEFAQAVAICQESYRDKLIAHQQNLVFNGQEKTTYDRQGNIVSRETVYPIRLIELELKKHDPGYRDKQEVAVTHSGGVMIAPAEMASIDDWEKKFNPKDITPSPSGLIEHQEIDEEDPF